MLKTFTDNAGRSWTVNINNTSIKEVREFLDINLLEVLEGDLLNRLAFDPITLVDIIYVLCKEQADKNNISDKDFGRAMAGDSIAQATQAFMEALAAYFPQLEKRTLLKTALKKIAADEKKIIDQAQMMLESPLLDQKLEKMLKKYTDSFSNAEPY